MKKLTMALGIVVASLFVFGTSAVAVTDGAGDIFVKLHNGVNGSYISSLCTEFGADSTGYIEFIAVFILHVDENVSDVTVQIHADPYVKFAEQPRIYLFPACYLPSPPDDPGYNYQWNLQLMDFAEAWECSHGEDQIVGIVDCGYRLDHPDLQTNRWVNPGEDLNHDGIIQPGEVNAVDDDDNGFVDDFYGWDTVEEDNEQGCIGCSYWDGRHGSRTTGIVGASTDNDLGIAGGGWDAKFIHMRTGVDGPTPGGSELDEIEAIDYLYDSIEPAKIVLLNFAGSGSNSMRIAIDEGYNTYDVLYVAPVGNQSQQSEILYPAKYENVMAVGGVNSDDEWWDTDSDGSIQSQLLDLAAPSEDVPTTGNTDAYPYVTATGTCFSGPHVIAAAALCRDYFLSNGWEEVTADTLWKALIAGSATWKPFQSHKTKTGFGRLSAYDALKYRDSDYAAARISRPLDGETIGGAVSNYSIRGIALATNIDKFEICLDGNCEHVAINPDVVIGEERINGLLAYMNTDEVSLGSHTLTLKVYPGGSGGGDGPEGDDINPPPELYYKSHTVSFEKVIIDNVIPILTPDSTVLINDERTQLDYEVMIENPTGDEISFKYKIEYDYNDSTYAFLGPYNCTLAAQSAWDYPVGLSTAYSEDDSSGTYMWKLKLLDMSDQLIAVDSLRVIKE
jgi:hypothetical protein